jgi:hypothetical protein
MDSVVSVPEGRVKSDVVRRTAPAASVAPAGPVERGVNRKVAAAFVICCSLAVPARGDGGDIDVRLVWPDGFAVRCGIPIGDSRLVLLGGGTGDSIEMAAGLDGPLVRAGPLAPAGLLREAAGPLRSGPGTGTENTGLRLDASFGARAEASVQVTLIPEAFAVLWLRSPGDTDPPSGLSAGFLGGTLGPVRVGPLLLEAIAGLGEPGPSKDGEDWTRDGPLHPPGLVLLGAARIRLDLPWVSAGVSGGWSAAERAPPGWFALGTGSFGSEDIGVDLCAAAASCGYLELGGGDDPGGMKWGVRLRLAGSSGRFVVRYVLSADLPGFAPGPFLAAGEEIDITLERRWTSGAGVWEAGLSASNRIETGADGAQRDDPTGRVSVCWEGHRLAAGLAVDINRDDGVGIDCSLGTGELPACAGVALEADFAVHDGATRLGFSVRAVLALDAWEATVRAGFDGAPLVRGGLRAARPRISLGWRVTAPADPAPAGRGP